MQLKERSWSRRLVMLVVAFGLLGAALGYGYSTVAEPGYDASTFLLVTPSGDVPVQTSEVQYAQAISQIVTNPSVLAAGEDSDDLPDDPDRVRADASPNAPLIELVANAEDADTARRQAQAAAEAVATYTQDRVDVLGFRAVVLAPATTGVPAGLSPPAHVLAGAAMGAVLGGLLGMLRGQRSTEVLDPWPAHPEVTAARPGTPAAHAEADAAPAHDDDATAHDDTSAAHADDRDAPAEHTEATTVTS